MSVFDRETQVKPAQNNRFIKHDTKMLDFIYGTEKVQPFWVADMDFAVAQPITDELHRLVERGVYAYEFNSQGVYRALSHWYQHRHQLTLQADNFVMVPGVLSGLSLVLRELTETGDGVLIQTPAYHQFDKLIRAAGRTVVTNPLSRVDAEYQLDLADMERKIIEQNVKALLLCNPHNPTGRVWRRDELEAVVALAQKHDVWLVSDEVHSDIIYGDHRFTSVMALGYEKSIALLGSPAKTFGMHSISNGYIYTGHEAMLARFKSVVDGQYLGHGNAFTTFATIAAYEKGEEWLEDLLAYLDSTVSWIADFVAKQLPGVRMFKPEGTYQIWFDLSGLDLSDDALKALLIDAGVGLTPGGWFGQDFAEPGKSPNQYQRMNIATPRANIVAAFERLAAAVEARRIG
ncbi:MalY/PatB family protein [Ferrimonas pelagia]|uniref:cysteine-S-conjugate beta-lyase n=1 Tax=Ferrimonas pelagia TaxID=1177826 RepID=A0ABP9EYG0_9GAMM